MLAAEVWQAVFFYCCFLSESACCYMREPFYFLFYLLHSLQWFSVCWAVRDLLAVQCHHEGQQCVFLRASKCVAIHLVLMAICHNARHYQFIGHPLLLCSLNTNMTPSIQFPPAATGPNHSRSYQHCSQTTIKLSGWGKHQHSCSHPDPYTYIDEVLQTLQKTSSLCFFSSYTCLTWEKEQFYAGNFLCVFWPKLQSMWCTAR